MSQQHIDLWKTTANAFDQRHAAVGDKGGADTPCSEWDVSTLVAHAVGVQQMFIGGMVGAEIPEGADWSTTKAAIEAAMTPEALAGTTNHPSFGEVPKAMLVGIGTSDLLVHTWDLARALGTDETLPPEAVTICFGGLQQLPEEVRLGDGRFATPVETADDADEQTKFLSFSGRQV